MHLQIYFEIAVPELLELPVLTARLESLCAQYLLDFELTSLCQRMVGVGKPVALHASRTVESLRTLSLSLGFTALMLGGTEKASDNNI